MKRKLTALILVFTMLVSLSPAVAADEMSATPTVEEILNEYHQKAFDAQRQGENESTSTWSTRDGAAQTLEQETVDTLTEAGYEAYNVTADNYEELETQLKTDFASMGLTPEGSYIVVISGEDSGTSQPDKKQNSSRTSPDMNFEQSPEYGIPYFNFTYGDTTYRMRYLTVTAADNSALGMTSEVDLLEDMDTDDMRDALSAPLTILSNLPLIGISVTLVTLISDVLPDPLDKQPASLDYRGASNWTIKYVQTYNHSSDEWRKCASVEYVTLRYFIDYTYYESATNQYEQISTSGTHGCIYSMYYNDEQYMLERAAIAFEYNDVVCYHDKVEVVYYKHQRPGGIDEVIITHHRALGAE